MDDKLTPLTPAMLDRLYRVEIEAVRRTLAEIVRESNSRRDADMKMLDERYAAQTVAITTAFASADKAVASALLAAEKAVDKAERAANERFAAVNEFRAQLADIMTSLISRAEAEAKFQALTEKLDNSIATSAADRMAITASINAVEARMMAFIGGVGDRVTVMQSRGVGGREAVTEGRADTQHTLAFVVAAVAVLGLVISTVLAFYFSHH